MLVEINLLPEKETRSKSLFVLLIMIAAIVLISAVTIYCMNRSYTAELVTMNEQIVDNEELIAYEQKKSTTYESSNSYEQLENAVKWAGEYPLKAVPLLQKLTIILPERGFIQTLNYVETGKIELGVQFDDSSEAAFYLNTLQEAEWVNEAKLLSLNAITTFYDKKIGQEKPKNNGMPKNEKYLPRYLGQFEIYLKTDYLKSQDTTSSNAIGGDE